MPAVWWPYLMLHIEGLNVHVIYIYEQISSFWFVTDLSHLKPWKLQNFNRFIENIIIQATILYTCKSENISIKITNA